jgi:hypothetical protein
MPSEDDLSASAVKGTLSYGESKIKEWVKKFKDRKIAFIQDEETIDLVKEQLKSGEWDLIKKYLRDQRLKILVQMGLTLRRLDHNRNQPAIKNLRDKIVKKYGQSGLHIAQFVQNKILTEFIGSYVSLNHNLEDLIRYIEELLNHLERQVIFIKAEDNAEKLMRDIIIKLTANVPDVFIIFARESALKNGQKIKEQLFKKKTFAYRVEVKQELNRLLIFLFRKREENN